MTQSPDGVFTVRTATGQHRTVHPADLREAQHFMAEEHPSDTRNQTPTKIKISTKIKIPTPPESAAHHRID